jgi:RHS repeat-associated protein
VSYAGVKESRHHIYAGKEVIGEVVVQGNGAKQTRYFHADQVGSIDAVTDDKGNLLARWNFDPFGNRTLYTGDSTATRHGFTGHEMLPEVNLVHMNGRLYDPVIARFVSADPQIQFPDNLQSYNRYSYVLNNPLIYTDPSGYGLFGSIGKFLKKLWDNPVIRIGVTIAVAYFTGVGVSSLLTSTGVSGLTTGVACTLGGGTLYSLTTAGAVVTGAAAGFAAGFVGSEGNLRYGLVGALSGGVAGGINAYFANYDWYVKAVATGTGGGIGAKAYGGDFGRGFLYAFAASLGKTVLDWYVQERWTRYPNYSSSLDPASKDAVYKATYE